MRIPPKKPHFFRPILPGFLRGLLIPKSFFKYLAGQNCEHALLRRGCKKWAVNINGHRFGDGWRKFAENEDLHVGDFIVFRHEGHMVFDVMVFKPSACERECPPCDVREVESMQERESPKAKSVKRFDRSNKILKKKPDSKHSKVRPSSSTLDHPYFMSTVKPYNIKEYRLNIPMGFARSNGLNKRRCEMILRDKKRRSWSVNLIYKASQVYIGRGWREFCITNGLKEGDSFGFELVENGKKPIWNFHGKFSLQGFLVLIIVMNALKTLFPLAHLPQLILYGSAEKDEPFMTDFKPKTTSTMKDLPYFVSTLKPYSIKNYTLNLPMKFARSNGLANSHCEMILRDEKHRSWPVELEHKDTHVSIRSGWRKFSIANGLKEGDAFKFEIVEYGKKPIANFHLLEESAQKDKPHMTKFKANNTSTLQGLPYFVSTLKPYSIKWSTLNLPMEFARSNGLAKKHCEMILKDEKHRSWPVELKHKDTHVYINNGWRRFCSANGLKEGDAFKFEVVENGKKPIVNFHCKFFLLIGTWS
ncbi:unnamed protein product [Ilex paraguariensis]|uniref:TF-B3 domain-containing protein n=1 Tax=Ilex paraguariensis TaxID=185542 RepID=A0ABC8S3I3_9AQUA